MKLPPGSREFLASLNAHGVKYLIVGGWAVVWHGHPRTTGDLDVFVEVSPENAAKLAAAVEQFVPGVFGWKAEDFLDTESWFQMGQIPQRIDILTFAEALDFASAWGRRVEAELDGVRVAFLSREDLLANKRAVGRDRDRDDVRTLERRPPPKP